MRPVNKRNFGPNGIKVTFNAGGGPVSGYIVNQIGTYRFIVTANGTERFVTMLARTNDQASNLPVGYCNIIATPYNADPQYVTRILGSILIVADGTRMTWRLFSARPGEATLATTGVPPDIIPPTITSPANVSVNENSAFSQTLTANEPVNWKKVGGQDQLLFDLVGTTLSLTPKNFEQPLDGDHDNVYVVVVRATDPSGNITDQTIRVTVLDVFEDLTPPVITSSVTPSVAENSAFSLTLTANETVTWAKTGGADANRFALSGATLSMAAQDFETPSDSNADNVYEVEITATDTAGNVSTQLIRVTVTDVADTDITPPTITSAASISIAENTAFSLTLTANETVTWAKSSGPDVSLFALTGNVLSMPARDYESPADANSDNVYVIQIQAMDLAGNISFQTISVTITNVDEIAPTITSSSSLSIAESSAFSHTMTANETVTWTKTGGDDASLFTLVGSTLTMSAKDFEVPVDSNSDNVYVVEITATDTAGNATVQTISVSVTNIDDTAPTITSPSAINLAENAAFSHTLTANETVTWTKIGGADQALFTLSGSTLTMPARDFESPTDANSDNIYIVTVRATDTAGNASQQTISVTVTDVDDVAPVILTSGTQTVSENVAFSITLTADKSVTWSLAGTDAALFGLSGANLTMSPRDFEAPQDANSDNVYVVIVIATDASSNATQKTISVTVTDAVEGINGLDFSLASNSGLIAVIV